MDNLTLSLLLSKFFRLVPSALDIIIVGMLIAFKSTDPSLGAAIPTGGPSTLFTMISSFAPAA